MILQIDEEMVTFLTGDLIYNFSSLFCIGKMTDMNDFVILFNFPAIRLVLLCGIKTNNPVNEMNRINPIAGSVFVFYIQIYS